MQFQLLPTLALAVFAAAEPIPETQVASSLCSSGQQALCCSISLNGMVNTNCQTPGAKVKTNKQFHKQCNSKGFTAECCTTSLSGVSLVCTPAA